MAIITEDVVARLDRIGQGPVGFAPVRNERRRLGAWLAHYRAIGVERFVVVDNGSTDGGQEFLEAQPDVVALRSDGSFAAANCGIEWLTDLHRLVRPGTWILFADADELLVYRGWPARPLRSLLADAEAEDATAALAFMLDMYPDGPLESAPAGADLMAAAPCFDGEYVFRRPPTRPWQPPAPGIEVLGGPRLRLLSSLDRERRSGWLAYLLRGQFDRVLPFTPDALLPLLVALMPRQMPNLSKVPLVRAGSGALYANVHTAIGARPFHENAVLLHYKFLADFAAKVAVECGRHEHYRRGSEYLMYAKLLKTHGALDLRHAGTRRFAGAEQLVQLGLIRDLSPLLAPHASRGQPQGTREADPCRSSDGPEPSPRPPLAA
ncbi:MAG TPA: glycosyltransferase family 2 protein [Hyphomicrobiales bacterium]|nr:glycosyltransferase family 2 protein [Hyphomicrobiales bacterium]